MQITAFAIERPREKKVAFLENWPVGFTSSQLL